MPKGDGGGEVTGDKLILCTVLFCLLAPDFRFFLNLFPLRHLLLQLRLSLSIFYFVDVDLLSFILS